MGMSDGRVDERTPCKCGDIRNTKAGERGVAGKEGADRTRCAEDVGYGAE